jgi:threonine dehydrogenase-like Zn-dependent dehydrogenase
MFAAAVLLRALGASYSGMTEVNEKRIKFAESMGYADDILNATDPGLTDKVLAATNGDGVDLLFDCMNAPTDMQTFSMLRKGGTYIVIGLTKTVTLDKLLMTRNEYRVQSAVHYFTLKILRML